MITYQQETWPKYYQDCQELWKINCDALGNGRKLEPAIKIYEQAAADGSLQIITARNENEMIGYHLTFVQPNTHHCSILCGYEDSSYVSPKYQFGRVRMRLIKYAEDCLRQYGVQEINFTVNAAGGTGRMMEAMGFTPCATIYNKRL